MSNRSPADRPVIPWREIELACVSGMSFKEASEKFKDADGNPVIVETIRKRASRNKWPTPTAIGHRARELAKQKANNTEHSHFGNQETAIERAAEAIVDRGKKYQDEVFERASKAVKASTVRPPKTWKDYEIADKVARRSIGLDNTESVNQVLLQINEAAGDDEVESVVPAEIVDSEVIEAV